MGFESASDKEVLRVMAKIDAKSESPMKRANRVLDALRKDTTLSTWDVTCFCVEFLGMMVPAYPWLEKDARSINRLVYLAHYIHYGGPADDKTLTEALG